MIGKIKLAACLLVFALMAGSFALCNFERRQNRKLRNDVDLLASRLRLAQVKAKMECPIPVEKKIWARKPRAKPKAGEFPALPAPCAECLKYHQYGLELRDPEGRWIFTDANVFDKDPGGLVLTDKFWREVGCPENRAPRSGRPKRLKNRLLIGLELENAKLDYAYSPLGFRTSNFELNLALYAAIQFNYSPLLPAGVSAGLGIETRF